ncbi:MAG: hypothetical protein HW421_3999 [Ignavibacteria bacterium]|nr:hypothetical protein [Ignavibacteria bacterium]
MYEKIIDIIVYVISELRQNKKISDINIDELLSRGYTNAEISTAFSWLVDRIEFSDTTFVVESFSNEESFRILHEAEKDLFTTEAWGDLVSLHSLRLLTNEHIESIIERAMMLGIRKIDSGNLKSFVAMLVFNAESNSNQNSRFMLNGNDTIN